MRLFFTILAVILTIATTCPAQRLLKPFETHVGLGVSFDAGPDEFTVWHLESYHISGGLAYPLGKSVKLMGKVEYNSFPSEFGDGYGYWEQQVGGGERRILRYGIDIHVTPRIESFPLKPYALGGIGLARMWQTEFETFMFEIVGFLDPYMYDTSTELYYNFGGGATIALSDNIDFFVQETQILGTDPHTAVRHVPAEVDLEQRTVDHQLVGEVQGILTQDAGLETASVLGEHGDLLTGFQELPDRLDPYRVHHLADDGEAAPRRCELPAVAALAPLEPATSPGRWGCRGTR